MAVRKLKDVYKRQVLKHATFTVPDQKLTAIVGDSGSGKSTILNLDVYKRQGSYIVFFVDPNGWSQTMLGNGTEQSYIDTMQATANTGILIAMFAAVIILSLIHILTNTTSIWTKSNMTPMCCFLFCVRSMRGNGQ